jgi:toxin ParE1/3/4
MRIRWTPPAAADMQGISDYLRIHHPQYRQPTVRKLYDRIRALKEAPFIGRPGSIEGTREIVFTPLP